MALMPRDEPTSSGSMSWSLSRSRRSRGRPPRSSIKVLRVAVLRGLEVLKAEHPEGAHKPRKR
jgi:hypothetical protein